MSASAAFELSPDNGSTYGATPQSVSAGGATVRCRLLNVAGIKNGTIVWTCIGTNNHTVALPTITPSGSPFGQIASFAIPAGANQAYIIQCDVNGGPDVTNEATTRHSGKFYVLNVQTREPAAAGETTESRAIRGVVEIIDEINNGSSSGGGGGTPDFPIPSVPVIASSSATGRDSSFGRPNVSYGEYIAAHPTGLNGPGAVLIAPGLYGTAISVPSGPQRLVSLGGPGGYVTGGGVSGDIRPGWARFTTVTTHINISGDDSDGVDFVGIYASTAFVNNGAYGGLGCMRFTDCGSPLVTFPDGNVVVDGAAGFATGTINSLTLYCDGKLASPQTEVGFTTTAIGINAKDSALTVGFQVENYDFEFQNCFVAFTGAAEAHFLYDDDGSHKLVMDENTRRYSFGAPQQHFADFDDSGTTLNDFDLGSTCDNGGLASPMTHLCCPSWLIGCNATPVTITGILWFACPGAFPGLHEGINDRLVDVTIKHQSTLSVAKNRIITQTGADIVVRAGDLVRFVRDRNLNRWRVFTFVSGG